MLFLTVLINSIYLTWRWWSGIINRTHFIYRYLNLSLYLFTLVYIYKYHLSMLISYRKVLWISLSSLITLQHSVNKLKIQQAYRFHLFPFYAAFPIPFIFTHLYNSRDWILEYKAWVTHFLMARNRSSHNFYC